MVWLIFGLVVGTAYFSMVMRWARHYYRRWRRGGDRELQFAPEHSWSEHREPYPRWLVITLSYAAALGWPPMMLARITWIALTWAITHGQPLTQAEVEEHAAEMRRRREELQRSIVRAEAELERVTRAVTKTDDDDSTSAFVVTGMDMTRDPLGRVSVRYRVDRRSYL